MILLVDIGNTSYHLGLYEDKIIKRYVCKFKSDLNLILQKSIFSNVSKVYVSSVNSKRFSIFEKEYKKLYKSEIILLTVDIYKEIVKDIGYKIPNIDILGPDLLFDVIGGEKASIIADYGTAFKLLYLDDKKEFKGGVIGPGLSLINRSLFDSTELLDNYKVITPSATFSLQTMDSINSNSTYGEAFKLIGYVNYINDNLKLNIDKYIITGGDGALIDKILKEKLNFNKFEIDDNLCFKGMLKVIERLK